MSQFLLMYITGRRLACVISVVVIMESLFLVAVFVSGSATSVHNVLATRCLRRNNSNEWLYPRGKGRCDIDNLTDTNEVVFAFQLPLSVKNADAEYSRWQQYLLGYLRLDKPQALTVEAGLAYRNQGDPDNAWQLHAFSVEERTFEDVPLFALGSLHHNYYLLNIRIPENQLQDLWLHVVNQNSDFTKVWVSLKMASMSFIVNMMIAFWKRKRVVPRSLTLLEYTILCLGATLTLLNVPLEYISLVLPVPFMSLLNDIRLDIFYAALWSFWLVLAGELLKIHDNTLTQSTFRSYWKHLSAVAIGCLSLFIFDLCQHGFQLHSPFFFININLTLIFNIVAGISASIYFIFLCYMVWKVFCTLNIKHTLYSNMSVIHLLIHKRFLYRLKFFMLATLLCAGMTITEFICGRAAVRHGDLQLRHTSAFYLVVHITWIMYTAVVILFCIPISLNLDNSGKPLESVSATTVTSSS